MFYDNPSNVSARYSRDVPGTSFFVRNVGGMRYTPDISGMSYLDIPDVSYLDIPDMSYVDNSSTSYIDISAMSHIHICDFIN